MNEDLVYLPHGWIGCVGFFVHRRTERVMLLGSLWLPYEWAWAFYHRFSFGGTKFDRHDALVIRTVHKPKEALKAMRRVGESDPKFENLAQHLTNPPCVFRDVDLLFFVRDFMEIETNGYFDFEVNPISGE